jgi:hypothetical protein
MLYGNTGGEGVGSVGRYLCTPLYTEKRQNGNNVNHFLEREKSGNIKERSW